MTACFPLGGHSGAQTLRKRQSSLPLDAASVFQLASIWAHVAPYSPASRTPCHGSTGAGGFQRRSPTGGAANGMPLNTAPLCWARPRIWPPVTATMGSD